MRTVFTSLSFYDSLDKQDVTRTNAVIPIHCPRTQLPSFEICMGAGNIATVAVSTVTSVKLVSCTGAETEIIGYFNAIPKIYHPTDTDFNTYIKYNGDTLKTVLPRGNYYIKLANNDSIFYSDWIRVDNIYPNLATAWTNHNYNTFSSSGFNIASAISTSSATKTAFVDTTFSVKKDENIIITLFATLNTGEAPKIVLSDDEVLSAILSNAETITAGLNIITLIATKSINVTVVLYNTLATNFSLSNIWVRREYSPKFIKITFSNTDNFGDLLYEDSFAQVAWLKGILNNPTHEMVNVGEEKDGIFIAEKIVSKYVYSIISYVSRGLYNCLVRLPQHDTITITDEVGNTYTPAVGNIIVEPAEWVSYETCKLTIKFNDGANSNFSWVK